ncbi:MAG: exodeoxyribonuclease V subunit alpha [Ilumatobacteraceae bacterium]
MTITTTPLITPPNSLIAYRDAHVIDDGDIAAATVLVRMSQGTRPGEPSDLAWVALGLVLRTSRDGHTCVDLDRIADWAADTNFEDSHHVSWPTNPGEWVAALQTMPALVGNPGDRTPLILDDHRVYLARAYAQENSIASILTRNNAENVNVLLGGPGTGKTTEVARRLVERFSDGSNTPRLALAAPTGKAATRMTQVLYDRCVEQQASREVINALTNAPARTVHSLLSFNPHRTPRFKFGPSNPLPYDLVVIDEASMLSSSLMFQLLEALPPDAEILLVGDPDQLASIESGTVLADIAASSRKPKSLLASRTQELTIQHRFGADSGIAALASAVRDGDTQRALEVLSSNPTDITWVDTSDRTSLDTLIEEIVAHALQVCEAARANDDDSVLRIQREMQVLCAHRSGTMGATGWNGRIEARLGSRADTAWYAGRLIMVNRNTPSLNLSNGDVGVVMATTPDSRTEAVFGQPGQSQRVPTSRLKNIETVHGLTIHKSQGSEYGHAVVVLPDRRSRILTRELLYTGITRAIDRLTIVGTRGVIEAAIARPIRRASGLTARL